MCGFYLVFLLLAVPDEQPKEGGAYFASQLGGAGGVGGIWSHFQLSQEAVRQINVLSSLFPLSV